MPIRFASSAASARSSAARPASSGGAAGPEQPPVLVRGVGDPRVRARLAVERQRRLEVAGGQRPVTERRGEHPQVAVGGAVAGHGVPDHHAAPGVRQKLVVDQPRHLGIADDRAHVGQVRERRQPERRAQRVEPVCADPVELGARLLQHPQLGHQGGEARPPGRGDGPRRQARARPGPARRAGPARGGSRTSGCRRRSTDRGRRAGGSTPATARPPPPPRAGARRRARSPRRTARPRASRTAGACDRPCRAAPPARRGRRSGRRSR